MGVLTVTPNPGEDSSSPSSRGLGSKKENSVVSWPDLKLDQDMHAYQSRWEVRKQQLVSVTYFDSLGNTTIYF